jgi:hypothetical protein
VTAKQRAEWCKIQEFRTGSPIQGYQQGLSVQKSSANVGSPPMAIADFDRAIGFAALNSS